MILLSCAGHRSGGLRFWWRATRGGQYPSLETLKQAEDALWGAAANEQTGGPSPIQIAVAVTQSGHNVYPFTVTRAQDKPSVSIPPYFAFPLRTRSNKTDPCWRGISTGTALSGESCSIKWHISGYSRRTRSGVMGMGNFWGNCALAQARVRSIGLSKGK